MAKPKRHLVEINPENYRRLQQLKEKYPLSPSIPVMANEAMRVALGLPNRNHRNNTKS